MTTILSKAAIKDRPIYCKQSNEFAKLLTIERQRIIRLCTAIIGHAEVSEDLVQETLIEAWRNIEKLRNPEAIQPWLSGIARNVCARWIRKQGKQPRIKEGGSHQEDISLAHTLFDFDLEFELEREELGLLLDRALAALPSETRYILIQKFIADLPYNVIAEQMGLSENAVAVRIHRGKLSLKKLLKTELRSEADMFGLVDVDDVWRETRIWCTQCGVRRMMGRLDAQEFALRCPDCNREKHHYHTQDNVFDYGACKTFQPVLNRFYQKMDAIFSAAKQDKGALCRHCKIWLPLKKGMPCYLPHSIQHLRGLHFYCPACNAGSCSTLDGLVLKHKIGWRFWHKEKRIRTLPEISMEVDGMSALHIPFQSIKRGATLDVIVRKDTYEFMSFYVNGVRQP